MEAKIKEIFPSVQGEGPFIGYRQLFVRFCGCNLNCTYCDTDYSSDCAKVYSPKMLFEEIASNYDLKIFHSISLTGGEPLLYADFLEEFLSYTNGKINTYLETNATLSNELNIIKKYIDIISADIKLKSVSGMDTFALHDKFFKNCAPVKTFAKVVFDTQITEEEIIKSCELGQKYSLELVLQPKMDENSLLINSDFCNKILEYFVQRYSKTRLIPQVHKFLNIR